MSCNTIINTIGIHQFCKYQTLNPPPLSLLKDPCPHNQCIKQLITTRFLTYSNLISTVVGFESFLEHFFNKYSFNRLMLNLFRLKNSIFFRELSVQLTSQLIYHSSAIHETNCRSQFTLQVITFNLTSTFLYFCKT